MGEGGPGYYVVGRKLRSSRQLPRRFSRPPEPGRRQTASSSQRLLPDPLLSYHHYNNNNIHAITTLSLLHPHQHYLCVSPLLFFSFSVFRFIHRPSRSTAAHHLNPGQPLPRLAFRGTILLVPHANSSRRARSPEPASSQPAAQHPRNTASSPSSSSLSSQHSPHLHHHHPPPTLRQRRLTCDV